MDRIKIRKLTINISFSIFILFMTTELLSFISYKYKILPINIEPSYLVENGIEWRNEKSPWGAWHKANFTDSHKKRCFDVTYQSNNVGARDSINYDQNLNANSIVLIGDSFAEGYGVSVNNIFAKLLEKSLNKTVLNFGAAGSFGSIQQEILYRELASTFPHNELIQFFLPANDFTESDIKYWQNDLHRYRPYFKKTGPETYSIYYPEQSIKDQEFDTKNRPKTLFEKASRMTFSSNIIRNIKLALNQYEDRQMIKDHKNSYFFDDDETTNGTLFFIEKLLNQTSNLKRRTLVLIPILSDIEKINKGIKYRHLNWYQKIIKITKETKTNLIDLAEHVPLDNYKNLFFDCDSHWSPEGNKWAAKIVSEQTFKN